MRYAASLIAGIAFAVVAIGQLAPAKAAAASPRLEGAERAIIRAINRQRVAAGLRTVRASQRLARAADYHSREMLAGNYFAHPSRNGSPFDQRIRRFQNSRAVGETLAMLNSCGRGTAGRVVSMWMDSPPHRAVILSPAYRRAGVGRRTGSLGGGRACVVTADFASRR